MHLSMLTHEELLRIANAEINEMTSTPLEVELLQRLVALLEEQNDALVTTADEYDIDVEDLRELGEALILDAHNTAELLSAIGEAGFDSPAEIKREFELARQFRTLANDAGDVFERLKTLTTTATA